MGNIKGANLGNWLVLEKWMDPTPFLGSNAEDETWLNRPASWIELNSKNMLAEQMKKHRDTYVTEKDFEYLSAHGFTHVRIPVPYFIFGDYEPYSGCIEYLDKAFVWAKKYGIKILVDVHTTPGCQNGYDNGGIVGVCKWHRDKEGVKYILRLLVRLAKRYRDEEALFGIEVVNEPIGLMTWLTAPSTGKARDKNEAKGSAHVPTAFLKKFYLTAYKRLRKVLPEDKAIVFHDGFRMLRWGKFFKENGMKNVFLDVHLYIFAMEKVAHIHKMWLYKAYIMADRIRMAIVQRNTPVIVGEWCISCSYANDVPDNNTYEKIRRYNEVCKLELDAWKDTAGWFYWNYQLLRDKSAEFDEPWKESWDLRRCIENGWFVS